MSNLDLDNPPPDHQFSVSVERAETQDERRVRLFKDVALFVAALVFVGVFLGLAVRAVLSPAASADEKKWAMSAITGSAGGLIGYLVRR